MLGRKLTAGMIIVILVWTSRLAWGLIYWEADYNENNKPPGLEAPYEKCLAKIDDRISATVIDPNFIITAGHWDGTVQPGDMVNLGREDSNDYVISEKRESGDNPDIMVCRVKKYDPNEPDPENMEDANFSDWVALYSNNDEVGRELTIGGYNWIRTWDGNEIRGKGVMGELHWGRNVVFGANEHFLGHSFSRIGQGDYLKHEVKGGHLPPWTGDSGSGWFIKDGIEWKIASLYKEACIGPRISHYNVWIDTQIRDMLGDPNYVRPLPDLADIHWTGSEQGDWFNAGNWDTSTVPTSADRVRVDNETTAVISDGNAAAKELFVGVDDGGSVTQTDANMAIEQYLYVGGRTDCNSSTYTISGGEFNAKGIVVGINSDGKFDVNEVNVDITLRYLLLGKYGELEAEPNSTIQFILLNDPNHYRIDGRLDIYEYADANKLSGLGNLTIAAGFVDNNEYDPNTVLGLEAAGKCVKLVTIDDFNTTNFVLGELQVGFDPNDVNDAAGGISIELVDRRFNHEDPLPPTDYEALYVNTLTLGAGATFETDPNTGNPAFELYYKNGGNAKMFFIGDVDIDGDVDYDDLGAWNPNATSPQWSDGDMNGDRVVDTNDYDIIEAALKKAKAPWPPNGSTVQRLEALPLTWVASVDANSHDVYFGTSFDDVNDADTYSPQFQGNQSGTTFYAVMPPQGTYFWRIDEVNDVNITKGYVWTFTNDLTHVVLNGVTGLYYDCIQDAIDDANSDDELILARDTYYENLNFTDKKITLTGSDPNDADVVASTIIDGNDAGSVITFSSGDADSTVKGITITNGSGGTGGGIRCSIASPTISHCIFRDNYTSSNGGAIYCRDSDYMYVGNCYFISNSAYQLGGAIWAEHDYEMRIANCLFRQNHADWGGAIGTGYSARQEIINCTFSDNTADVNGGALWMAYADPYIANCILWGNTVVGQEEEVHLGNMTYPTWRCCDIYGCGGSGDWNDDFGIDDGGNIDSNPCFVNPDADDYHLDQSSLCINAGDPNGNYSGQTDLDGDIRVQDGRVDMGAYEYTYGLFYVKDSSNVTVVCFDNTGNIFLKGTLTPGTTPTATANDEFRIQDSSGDDVAIIDATDGNMYIDGTLYEDQSSLSPSGASDDFIIKDDSGIVVAYINDSGDLYLKGKVYENSNHP